jgi:predicted ATPase
MKITRLEIKDYQQFKDFTLDLTYPADHPNPTKAGKPLDKVCFIGQSGTGKTSLLALFAFVINKKKSAIIHTYFQNTYFNKKDNLKVVAEVTGFSKREKTEIFIVNNGEIQYSGNKEMNDWFDVIDFVADTFDSIIEDNFRKVKALFLETDLQKHINLLVESGVGNELIRKSETELRQERLDYYLKGQHKMSNIIMSSIDFQYDFFKRLLLKIPHEYEIKYSDYMRELPKKVKNPEKLVKELAIWLQENPNPRIEIAKKVNEIIKHFNLKVDEEWVGSEIKINTLQNEEIHLSKLSTGTKQILITSIVLYLLNLKDKIILFDEPENSLYPDIQQVIVKHYTDLAPESQFFFATHSPLIAAQFEPCERFILSFDEETGKVQARNGTVPEGDDPNDMLTKDFLLPTLLGKKGEQAYHRFIELKTLIHNADTKAEKHALTHEYLQIQKAYNF